MDVYGPACDSHGLIALIGAIWNSCEPWVETIASPSGVRATDVNSFAMALEQAGRPIATAIGCKLIGGGREVLFGSSQRNIAHSLDHGPAFQQTIVSISGARDPELGAHLLQSIGLGSRAWFGTYTPEPDNVLLTLKAGGFLSDSRWKLAGVRYRPLQHSTDLRALSPIYLERWQHAHRPFRIGWCNYWSAETCADLGFPDPPRDAVLLRNSRQLDNGAWLVRLTSTRLDLGSDEHLAQVAWAYDRFPDIGTM